MRKQLFFFFLFFCLTTLVLGQTSKFGRKFETTSGAKLTGKTIVLCPQASTYPADTLKLNETPALSGYYEREAVPDGEYKIYINGALYKQNIYVGEKRLSDNADWVDSTKIRYDNSYRIKKAGLGLYFSGAGTPDQDSIVVAFGETLTNPIITNFTNYANWLAYPKRVWADSASFYPYSWGIGDTIIFDGFANSQ